VSASSKGSSKQRALRARDAGLSKIAITTRALTVAAVAAAGAFSLLAARAQPGRAKAIVGSASTQVAGTGPGVLAGGQDAGVAAGSDANLAPPTTLPASSYQYNVPQVVSGAS